MLSLNNEDTGAEEVVNYNNYTVVELKSIAENKGIEVKSTMKKAEIIQAIQESEV